MCNFCHLFEIHVRVGTDFELPDVVYTIDKK